MGRKSISADDLRGEINGILEEYADDTGNLLKKVFVQYAKIGVRELRPKSPKRTGKYAKGWGYATEGSVEKQTFRVRIVNKAKPYLTHLLERGHLAHNGRRVPGDPHIEPIRKQIEEELTREVMDKLNGGE